MSKKEKQTEEHLPIETAFEQIDALIEEMEDQEVSLEDAFTKFQAGIELVHYCEGEIERIEKRVIQLTEENEAILFD